MNSILVPGKPPKERYFDKTKPKPHVANWFPYLATALRGRGIPTDVLVMPRPYDPDYMAWCAEFEHHEVNEDTILVGHSAGGDFLLHWLSDNRDVLVGKLALVGLWHDFRNKYGDFSRYQLDPNLNYRVRDGITALHSLDDADPSIHQAVHRLRTTVAGVAIMEFTNHGHFMLGNNMTSTDFPELLEVLAPTA